MIWNIDGGKSAIVFGVKHLMFSTVKGRFHKISGMVDWDEENPANSIIEATVDTGSIQTDDKSRDKHLRSEDFFDVKHYPYMTFKSTKVKPLGHNKYRLIGNMTIKTVTKEVTFEVDYAGRKSNAFEGNFSAFRATAQINRKEFGLVWNAAIEAGGVAVGDQIKIELLINTARESAVTVAA
ncbi:MAG: YceI family protein [Chloroflexi bacterium]|uniref:YceI family protein n=1 Tax=Candidatus Chlorohelix allophototropha TaxID=3003348 RepID=A0A8T7LRE9_9CHLR|nr:YceI family protein [Chloroflexota bacterium]WJW66459.1 YceI family protein [Chloroflexota bacterium L227-S17]